MGALVTLTENAWLNHWLRNDDITGIGDAGGLRGSVTAGVVGVSACTAWPGEAPATGQTTFETNYAGYTRATVARSGSGWNAASNGSISPVADIKFGKRTSQGAAVEISYVIIGDAASGDGTARLWGAIGDPTFLARVFVANNTTNDTILIPGHGLASGDRIAFFAFEPGGDFPPGITQGDVYHVRSGGLTTDEFTFATTAGGAAVNITALGSGYAIKIKPISVTEGIEPALLASAAFTLG